MQGEIIGSLYDDNHKLVIGNIFKETCLKGDNSSSVNNYIFYLKGVFQSLF